MEIPSASLAHASGCDFWHVTGRRPLRFECRFKSIKIRLYSRGGRDAHPDLNRRFVRGIPTIGFRKSRPS